MFGLIYAAPNLFGEDPAIQISAKNTAQLATGILDQAKQVLAAQNLPYLSARQEKEGVLVRFNNTDTQLHARDVLKATLGDEYIVALNLAPRTPAWLEMLGAHPMKLGLDLRGGVNFLLAVDLDAVIKARLESDVINITRDLRENNIRYAGVNKDAQGNLQFEFRDGQNQDKALSWLVPRYKDYTFTQSSANNQF